MVRALPSLSPTLAHMCSAQNFGWIFMRSCEATITYWEHTLQEYLRENQWDVRSRSIPSVRGAKLSSSLLAAKSHFASRHGRRWTRDGKLHYA